MTVRSDPRNSHLRPYHLHVLHILLSKLAQSRDAIPEIIGLILRHRYYLLDHCATVLSYRFLCDYIYISFSDNCNINCFWVSLPLVLWSLSLHHKLHPMSNCVTQWQSNCTSSGLISHAYMFRCSCSAILFALV